ncbi:2500_t:CDS:2, partial [Acaulospora morrowiae]
VRKMTCEPSLKSIWIFLNIFIALIMTGINIVDAGAQSCCFSLVSTIQSSPNQYLLNVTASHIDAKKYNNDYVAAISFPQGYVVQGNPSSPYSLADCTLQQTSPPQYQCSEHVNGVFFIQFTVQTPKLAANSSPSASVIIFKDNCQQERFCTDLTAANENNSDTISLGPLGRWPKYAIIICAVILSLALVGACYLIYRRKTGNSYKDTSVTPGYNDKGANSIFSPRSLLRGGANDYDEPMPEPPKNTLVQFGNVTNDSEPSVKNRVKSKSKSTNDFVDRQSDSLKKSLSRRSKGSKNEKNYTSEMYNRSNLAPEDHSPSVVIDMNYGVDVHDKRKSGDHKKRVSANKKDSTKDFYSPDLSRSTSSRSRDNGTKNEKYETRKESMHQHRRRSNSLSREYDDERKSRGISKTTSRKYRSKSSDREHTRSRELTHGHSMRAKRSDHNDQEIRNSHRVKDSFEKSQDLSRSSTRAKKLSSSATERKGIEREGTHRNNSDNDSTTSSDTPASDRLPNTGGSRAPVNKRQSNGGSRLMDGSESGRNYDSVLDEMLGFSDYQGSDSSRKGGEEEYRNDRESEEKINENSSDDDVPVGILRSKIN